MAELQRGITSISYQDYSLEIYLLISRRNIFLIPESKSYWEVFILSCLQVNLGDTEKDEFFGASKLKRNLEAAVPQVQSLAHCVNLFCGLNDK